jgi:hypothetical protein
MERNGALKNDRGSNLLVLRSIQVVAIRTDNKGREQNYRDSLLKPVSAANGRPSRIQSSSPCGSTATRTGIIIDTVLAACPLNCTASKLPILRATAVLSNIYLHAH